MDYLYEMEKRYRKAAEEGEEYVEMMYYYLIECGTDRAVGLSNEEFRQLMQKQLIDGISENFSDFSQVSCRQHDYKYRTETMGLKIFQNSSDFSQVTCKLHDLHGRAMNDKKHTTGKAVFRRKVRTS